MLIAISITLGLCTAAMLAAAATRNRVPVGASMGIAAALRIAFALITSDHYTPWDARLYFRATGELVLHGREPLQSLPGREWNFLELMPYIHALELKTGLTWVYAVKIAPIVADVALVWLVSRLATEDSRTRALQYALNPLSLLVVSLHGQVEPVALALAMGGILLVRRDRLVLGGVLLGAAVAAKTWPVVILIAVLSLRRPQRTVRILLGAIIVPAASLLSGVVFLDTNVAHALGRVLSYSGYVRAWTWSGAWLALGKPRIGGYNSPVSAAVSVAIVIAVVITLYLLRRRPPESRALGALCAVLLCTAGFGPQYLLWVLPLAMAISGRWRYGYVIAATAWAGLAYLSAPGSPGIVTALRALSWLPAAMLVGLLVEQVRRTPDARDAASGTAGSALSHLGSTGLPRPIVTV